METDSSLLTSEEAIDVVHQVQQQSSTKHKAIDHPTTQRIVVFATNNAIQPGAVAVAGCSNNGVESENDDEDSSIVDNEGASLHAAGVVTADLVVPDNGTTAEELAREQIIKHAAQAEAVVVIRSKFTTFVAAGAVAILVLSIAATVLLLNIGSESVDPPVFIEEEDNPVYGRLVALLSSRYPEKRITERDPTNPEMQAFRWIVEDAVTSNPGLSDDRYEQRFALAVLYFSTNGPNAWFSNFRQEKPWLSAGNECLDWWWSGNTMINPPCDDQFRLVRLDLWRNNLVGTLPSELKFLSHLSAIHLRDNFLSGTLPPIDVFKSLQILNVGNNNLRGSIRFGRKGIHLALRELIADHNQLTGDIEALAERYPNLRILRASNNMLTGHAGNALERLLHLKIAMLSNNALVGSLPYNIWSENLELLGLSHNTGFSGTLDALTNTTLPGLQALELDHTNISGTIPVTIGSLSALHTLHMESTQIYGSIPLELWKLPVLHSLSLAHGRFTGTIPNDAIRSNELVVVNVWNNSLSGTIPPILLSLPYYRVFASNNFVMASNSSSCVDDVNNGTINTDRPSVAQTFLAADCEEVKCCTCNVCCRDTEPCAIPSFVDALS